MSTSAFETAYQALLRNKRLSNNTGQAALVKRLARLQLDLSSRKQDNGLQGLYIYGGVGTGKSRIADLFCATLPSSVTRRRAHFHEFMLDIHSRLHHARSASGYSDDPLPKIGRQVSEESRVLCFDEFQVTDIADAMILQRLFTSIWANGGMMVSTSNRTPDTLYENGLNRSLFLPFIELLKRKSEVWKMEGTKDYRLLASGKRQQTFFTDPENFEKCVETAKAGQVPKLRTVPVMMGRTLSVSATPASEETAGLVVFSSFADLCVGNVGAADYFALCRASKIIFLDGLRRFRVRELDYVRRFITLIDAAYESGTRVIICSRDSLDSLFREIVNVERQRATSHNKMSVKAGGGSSSSMMSTFVSGDTEWSATGLSEASLATGGAGETDVVFAIGRAMSRLQEMGSAVYGQKD
ncbi:hypothetical protein LTR37_004862 [Vermiconidia calcicola]|uniref:Uncharacterized protein n=1 Tax=Vermiconidia calcicola TaxID=1690605 RepID=A0ACC3NLJ7_9PEZI|nr:hypothetical protein LTR37_004862 [Vermiconidia calcicola]